MLIAAWLLLLVVPMLLPGRLLAAEDATAKAAVSDHSCFLAADCVRRVAGNEPIQYAL